MRKIRKLYQRATVRKQNKDEKGYYSSLGTLNLVLSHYNFFSESPQNDICRDCIIERHL